jgi:Protein of unknown function (DUF433)
MMGRIIYRGRGVSHIYLWVAIAFYELSAVTRKRKLPVQTLLDYLEAGDTLDEFLEQYPGVSREQAIAALEEAKALMLARFEK